MYKWALTNDNHRDLAVSTRTGLRTGLKAFICLFEPHKRLLLLQKIDRGEDYVLAT